MLVHALLIWLLLCVLAVCNGAFREMFLRPRLGERAGHILSTLLLCAAILAVTALGLPWIHPANRQDALTVGVIWLALTLAFEFLAGHYLLDNSWQKIPADYNLLAGRIWPLVLITNLLCPITI